MSVEYRELSSEDDFGQCLELQRRVFGFSEMELVSPHFLRLIHRDNPPLGINVGVFSRNDSGGSLVGVMMGFATFLEKSVYCVMLGILPEYQSGIYGYKLLLKFRELALNKGVHTLYGIYEPLESSLARLYIGGMGAIGIRYVLDPATEGIPADKMYFKWEFLSQQTLAHLDLSRKRSNADLFDHLPLANPDYLPEAPRLLMELPDDWLQLKHTPGSGAADFQVSARKIFDTYINQRGYQLVDCISAKAEGGRKTYYVLEKSGD